MNLDLDFSFDTGKFLINGASFTPLFIPASDFQRRKNCIGITFERECLPPSSQQGYRIFDSSWLRPRSSHMCIPRLGLFPIVPHEIVLYVASFPRPR